MPTNDSSSTDFPIAAELRSSDPVEMPHPLTLANNTRCLIIPVTSLMVNCILLIDPDSRKSLIIDPGGNHERILAAVESERAIVEKIILTHAHFDHCLGISQLSAALRVKQSFTPQVLMHPGDQMLLDNLSVQCRMFGFPPESADFVVDQEILDGDAIECGRLLLKVIHTPGHSPGGCCLYLADEKLLISGDTLFAGSVGRTDLPGGDHNILLDSIRSRLMSLPTDTIVLPGHGDISTIAEEIADNPFVSGFV